MLNGTIKPIFDFITPLAANEFFAREVSVHVLLFSSALADYWAYNSAVPPHPRSGCEPPYEASYYSEWLEKLEADASAIVFFQFRSLQPR